jgi:hypothetical protein
LVMTENEISYKIIGAIYKVYNELGPGLLESVYEAALCYQLRKDGLRVENQVKLDVMYDGKVLPVDFRLDILVEDKVIVELKSVTEMKDVFHKQLLTYLRVAKKHLGIGSIFPPQIYENQSSVKSMDILPWIESFS